MRPGQDVLKIYGGIEGAISGGIGLNALSHSLHRRTVDERTLMFGTSGKSRSADKVPNLINLSNESLWFDAKN